MTLVLNPIASISGIGLTRWLRPAFFIGYQPSVVPTFFPPSDEAILATVPPKVVWTRSPSTEEHAPYVEEAVWPLRARCYRLDMSDTKSKRKR